MASEAISYQVPECQGRSQAPSEKADLYALGQIGIEMLFGSGRGDSQEARTSKDGGRSQTPSCVAPVVDCR